MQAGRKPRQRGDRSPTLGHARTYVRCRNEDPGRIDAAEAVESFLAGRVLVSFGLPST
ncbi:MAG TPA: hypothetical protein VGN42_06650 [Pirellulales bacterium]|nr:hypothetical protein [Pirellulales bacterium]